VPPRGVLQRVRRTHRDAPRGRVGPGGAAPSAGADHPLPSRRGDLDRELLQVHPPRRRIAPGRGGPPPGPLARRPRQLFRARPDPARLIVTDGGAYAQPTPREFYSHAVLPAEAAPKPVPTRPPRGSRASSS